LIAQRTGQEVIMNIKRFFLACALGLMPLPSTALNLATDPLFIASTEPRVMLVLSRDHELSKKAYNDYSDLDNDGNLDITYNDAVNYYGYFNSSRCYTYSSGSLGLGLFDVCPQRSRAELTHMGVRADVE
jgi:hypothetical protein